MYNSDDVKRENNKTKKSKNDHVKNVVTTYLQKRNYTTFHTMDVTKNQLLTYSSVENEVSRPNSILCSCYNYDPAVIDNNFTKFLSWLKELNKNGNGCQDLEKLIGPFFCHLYLDILRGGHPERAATFLKMHFPLIEKSSGDAIVKELLNSFIADSELNYLKEKFRSSKYIIPLSESSRKLLMKFIVQNCHVVFLQVLQTWFEMEDTSEKTNETDNNMIPNECCIKSKFQKIIDAAKDVEIDRKKTIFFMNITNTKHEVNCGIISRSHGIIIYNQGCEVHISPMHSYINVVPFKELKLNGHVSNIYAMTLSKNFLVTASCDGNLCIYSNREFNLINNCVGHVGAIYCVRISSNELYLASGSQDTTIRLWSISTGQTIRIFTGHLQAVTCIDFHPNCLYLTSGSNDRNIRVWSVEDAVSMRLLCGAKGTIYALSFNPLGQCLASASDDKRVRIWDILTGKATYEMKYVGSPVTKIQWSKDGYLLCGGSLDSLLRIWDYKSILENTSENKAIEPINCVKGNADLLNLEFQFGTFGCLTTTNFD